ncbi:MAG: Ig-like domain-containing protein [Anaerolineae bacterium]
MKQLWFAAICIGYMIGTTLGFSNVEPPNIDGAHIITAGDAWSVNIRIPNGTAGEQVVGVLQNGFKTIIAHLTLGTGGVANWQIPLGEITQSGETALIIYYGKEEYRQSLQVQPGVPTVVELFTSANSMPAYGEGSATIMVLPRDNWGNAADNTSEFQLDSLYPGGQHNSNTFTYKGGLGWMTLHSQGNPGRVRAALEYGSLSASLELTQTPGEPQFASLRLSPDCVFNDGRDRISLVATITDSHGNPVTDGTLVTFSWRHGHGSASTVDGQATLRLPAPTSHTGQFSYRATSGETHSNTVFLKITEETCSYD